MDYRKTIKEIYEEYKVDPKLGLTSQQVKERIELYGQNILEKEKKKSLIKMFVEQFKDPMVVILIVGAVMSLVLGEWIDASIILFVLILNAFIGVFQEFKAEKSLEALEKLNSPIVQVLRDGHVGSIDYQDLTIGDLVFLSSGSFVPADLRLVECEQLEIDESMLTGENEPVKKQAEFVSYQELPIMEQKNMAFMSTYVTKGKAVGLVSAIAKQSEVGHIAKLLTDQKTESSPLQIKLAQLSKLLGILTVGLCGLMFVIGLVQGKNLFDMLLLAISLAVAAIPEGLPAIVSITLAFSVQAMSKHHAIVRKLGGVETLGSVSVICSDKTGTLTQNRMSVVGTYPSNVPVHMYECMSLCHDVSFGDDRMFGDPMELALVTFAMKASYDPIAMKKEYHKISEVPFESKTKKMQVTYQMGSRRYLFEKGAIDVLLKECQSEYRDGRIEPLSSIRKETLQKEANNLANQALRVLAFAYKESNGLNNEPLIFLGYVGLMDPPRKGVKEAIETCHKASIKVAMITGDHPNTALAIARQLNITQNPNSVLTGNEIEKMGDEELKRQVKTHQIFARVSPTHKVRIVEAYQRNGEVVSMSGDGVNDAPALKKADVGIAMGESGSDVAKQASDLVLTDDHFASIVSAIEEGRNIYLNIKKAILYLLSCNIGEMMALILSVILMPHTNALMSAVQILWVNLVTDALPALAYSLEPEDPYIMNEVPRKKDESVFSHGGGIFTLMNGLLIGTITLVAYRYGLNISHAYGQTMAFMVLSISQLIHALNLRSMNHSIFKIGIFKNKYLLATCVLSIALQISVTIFPFFKILLKTVSLSMNAWIIIFLLSSLTLVLNEISKMFYKEEN